MLARFYTASGDAQATTRCAVPARYLPGEVVNPLLEEVRRGLPSVWQNPGTEHIDAILQDVQLENRIVIDVDDPYCTESERYGAKQVRNHLLALGEASALLVTTEALAEVYSPLHSDIRVIPSCIDTADWQLGRQTQHFDGKLRVGYAAGWTHAEDAPLVGPALAELSERKDVIIEFVGAFDPRWDFDYVRYPALPYPAYKAMLATWNIGLAPLVDNEINRTRSDLKFLDYAISGCACIASPFGPFEHLVEHEVIATASDDKEWAEALKVLVENDNARMKLAMHAYNYCRIERHPANQRAAYLDALGLRRSHAHA